MRFLACLRTSFVENLREWKVLSLALVFAPAFVFMMKGYYAAAAPAYRLQVVHHDVAAQPPGCPSVAAQRLVEAWRTARHADGQPMFTVDEADVAAAHQPRRSARSARRHGDGAQRLRGLCPRRRGHRRALPLDVEVQAVGAGRDLSEFVQYVPALLLLAVIMILFTAATALVKEVDRGTLTRLAMSRLRAGEFLAAIAVNQVGLGLVALGLAYLAALACGYRGTGSPLALLVVGAAGSLAVVAIAVLVSAFLRTMFALLTVGTLPFFISCLSASACSPCRASRWLASPATPCTSTTCCPRPCACGLCQGAQPRRGARRLAFPPPPPAHTLTGAAPARHAKLSRSPDIGHPTVLL